MAHRYFRTKREAERAAEKLRRAGFKDSWFSVHRAVMMTGWELVTLVYGEELDDILSRPMPRKKKEGK